MFDVGFFELVLVGVVALLVLGPERLPKAARTAGLWIGKAKGFLSSVKQDIDREIKAEELKRILKEQSHIEPLHEILDDTRKAMNEVKDKAETALQPPADESKSGTDSKPS